MTSSLSSSRGLASLASRGLGKITRVVKMDVNTSVNKKMVDAVKMEDHFGWRIKQPKVDIFKAYLIFHSVCFNIMFHCNIVGYMSHKRAASNQNLTHNNGTHIFTGILLRYGHLSQNTDDVIVLEILTGLLAKGTLHFI